MPTSLALQVVLGPENHKESRGLYLSFNLRAEVDALLPGSRVQVDHRVWEKILHAGGERCVTAAAYREEHRSRHKDLRESGNRRSAARHAISVVECVARFRPASAPSY